jgi:hypothetical protein
MLTTPRRHGSTGPRKHPRLIGFTTRHERERAKGKDNDSRYDACKGQRITRILATDPPHKQHQTPARTHAIAEKTMI